jgi:hypothetical protein
LDGTTSATARYTSGVEVYDGTTALLALNLYTNVAATTALTQATSGLGGGAAAGTLTVNDIRVVLSVLSVSATGFTIREAYTVTGSTGTAHSHYYAVATQ